jgi:hypothetical protein
MQCSCVEAAVRHLPERQLQPCRCVGSLNGRCREKPRRPVRSCTLSVVMLFEKMTRRGLAHGRFYTKQGFAQSRG